MTEEELLNFLSERSDYNDVLEKFKCRQFYTLYRGSHKELENFSPEFMDKLKSYFPYNKIEIKLTDGSAEPNFKVVIYRWKKKN